MMKDIFFLPCLGNRIMLSSKDHLGENILLRDKTDFRVSRHWEGAPWLVSENNYASFQSMYFSLHVYFQYLITLLVIKHRLHHRHIDKFIITLLYLTLTIIYNDKVIKHNIEL